MRWFISLSLPPSLLVVLLENRPLLEEFLFLILGQIDLARLDGHILTRCIENPLVHLAEVPVPDSLSQNDVVVPDGREGMIDWLLNWKSDRMESGKEGWTNGSNEEDILINGEDEKMKVCVNEEEESINDFMKRMNGENELMHVNDEWMIQWRGFMSKWMN